MSHIITTRSNHFFRCSTLFRSFLQFISLFFELIAVKFCLQGLDERFCFLCFDFGYILLSKRLYSIKTRAQRTRNVNKSRSSQNCLKAGQNKHSGLQRIEKNKWEAEWPTDRMIDCTYIYLAFSVKVLYLHKYFEFWLLKF